VRRGRNGEQRREQRRTIEKIGGYAELNGGWNFGYSGVLEKRANLLKEGNGGWKKHSPGEGEKTEKKGEGKSPTYKFRNETKKEIGPRVGGAHEHKKKKIRKKQKKGQTKEEGLR